MDFFFSLSLTLLEESPDVLLLTSSSFYLRKDSTFISQPPPLSRRRRMCRLLPAPSLLLLLFLLLFAINHNLSGRTSDSRTESSGAQTRTASVCVCACCWLRSPPGCSGRLGHFNSTLGAEPTRGHPSRGVYLPWEVGKLRWNPVSVWCIFERECERKCVCVYSEFSLVSHLSASCLKQTAEECRLVLNHHLLLIHWPH